MNNDTHTPMCRQTRHVYVERVTEPVETEDNRLIDWLAEARIDPYLRACGNDRDAATTLYLWNSAVASAMWEVLGHVECAVRHAADVVMTERADRLGYSDEWFYHDELGPENNADVEEAVQRTSALAERGHYEHTHDHVLAGLNFSFWRYLYAKEREAKLGTTLQSAFPHAPRLGRKNDLSGIGKILSLLLALRNWIAHHEPIWWMRVDYRYNDALMLLGYISPQLEAEVRKHSRVDGLLEPECKPPNTCTGKRPLGAPTK